MSVGKDLLDVPFDAMVFSLAKAIAQGQASLDKGSLATLKALAHQKFDWIPEVTETLTPNVYAAPGGVLDPSGNPVLVTGVTTDFLPAPPVKLTLLQAGIFPTFYQFTEATIEVKMAISQKTTSETSLDVSVSTDVSSTGSFGGSFWGIHADYSETVAYSSSVDFKTANTYSYSAEGSSSLSCKLRPVPPPSRIMPRFCTVSMLKGGSPEVTWA